MPIYEYRCEKCGDFETTQRITDDPLQKCPTCRRKVRRLISNTSFQLKGSGWYITDYARKDSGGNGGDKSSGSESGTSASETKAESTTETKTETKSETKSESKPASSKKKAKSSGEGAKAGA